MKLFKSILLVAVAATAFACAQDKSLPSSKGERITLKAGKPVLASDDQTRTQIIDGVPNWSPGDRIGVHVHSVGNSNHVFLGDHATACESTTFTSTGAIDLTSDAVFSAYYPYTEQEVGIDVGGENKRGAIIDLPAIQNPSKVSFDGKADLLVTQATTIAELQTGTKVEGLLFKRLTGVVRVNLVDRTTGNRITGQKIAELSLETEHTDYSLAGHVTIDFDNHLLYAPHAAHATKVTAQYKATDEITVEGVAWEDNTNNEAVYLSVYPHVLPENATLVLRARTGEYVIEKRITTPLLDIKGARITTLDVAITDQMLTSSVLGLPFADDFTDLKGVSGDANLTNRKNEAGQPLWSSSAYATQSSGGVCIGNDINPGNMTTGDVDLPAAYSVRIMAKLFNDANEACLAAITIGGTRKTTPVLTGDYASFVIGFNNSGKQKVRIESTGKPIVIESVEILTGTVQPTPILRRTGTETMNATAAGEVLTIDYTLANGVVGGIEAVSDQAFVGNIDTSTLGKVVCTVNPNTDTESGRTATITVSYPGARSFTVKINQDKYVPQGQGGTAAWIPENPAATINNLETLGAFALTDGVSATFTNPNGTANGVRFVRGSTYAPTPYLNIPDAGTMTISRPGSKISKIVFKMGNSYAPRVQPSTGTYDPGTTVDGRVWTADGAAVENVTFTATGGAVQIQSMWITYE